MWHSSHKSISQQKQNDKASRCRFSTLICSVQDDSIEKKVNEIITPDLFNDRLYHPYIIPAAATVGKSHFHFYGKTFTHVRPHVRR